MQMHWICLHDIRRQGGMQIHWICSHENSFEAQPCHRCDGFEVLSFRMQFHLGSTGLVASK